MGTEAARLARMSALRDRHAGPVLRLLTDLSGVDAAEALLDETMQRARRHIDHLDVAPEQQQRWLFTVARRVAIKAAQERAARHGTPR
ncbi:sigma-70 family RNA polymerase sigma factor [Catenuloplanes japonicus]|uniref:sigma factor n=1 Tax=Catenuloplanes japonicus TaxID=33876 RepID=UPI00068F7029|nr:sigma factor [Catenuloplanes japonicus]